VESDETIQVGMNKYKCGEDSHPEIELLKINPEVEETQIANLQKVKKSRNNQAVQKRLDELKTAAEGTENLMPFILAAVKEYTALGEIISALKEVFGEYQDPGYF